MMVASELLLSLAGGRASSFLGHQAGDGARYGRPVAVSLPSRGLEMGSKGDLYVKPFPVCPSLPSHVIRMDMYSLVRALWGP